MPPLLRAAHPGPALAVVVLSLLLGVAGDLDMRSLVVVSLAVLAGQLSVGWSNDLLDEARDRAVARTDKPLAAGEVSTPTVRAACAAAVFATVGLSLACGVAAGLVHLLCVVSAWAYNAGLKATVWSWLPYAVSFAGLTVFLGLAGQPSQPPRWWVPVAAALLGAGAHLLNVLPDIADDEATGIHGLPHRIGARLVPAAAVAVLAAATVVVVLGATIPWQSSMCGLAVVTLCAGVALTGRSHWPFLAAVGIALTDVVLLVAAG